MQRCFSLLVTAFVVVFIGLATLPAYADSTPTTDPSCQHRGDPSWMSRDNGDGTCTEMPAPTHTDVYRPSTPPPTAVPPPHPGPVPHHPLPAPPPKVTPVGQAPNAVISTTGGPPDPQPAPQPSGTIYLTTTRKHQGVTLGKWMVIGIMFVIGLGMGLVWKGWRSPI